MDVAPSWPVVRHARRGWKPPPRLSLSAWADAHYRLSAENAAEPGRWHTLPYQVEIMDAISDPRVEEITLMKSARVGFTHMISATIGYHVDHDPATMLIIQPTVDDAKNYSKETIAAMIRDVPRLSEVAFRDEDSGPKNSSNTILLKTFPGGVIHLVGANSGTGLRRVSRRIVMFDEVDAYPQSAGSEGDPIDLGRKRASTFWNRKIIAGSTPLVSGVSRIAKLFDEGDRRRYHVPCPHCGHKDILTFREQTGANARGHWMSFDASSPEAAEASACFICRGCGCEIGHEHKRWMIERGEWRAEGVFRGHASFHIWAAYSYSPGAAWGRIAKEFVVANAAGPEQLQTFVNTTLGEVWVEKGEAPEWRSLYDRAESYQIGTVPTDDVLILTVGIDVQIDRLVYEVIGWAGDLQSWSIEAGVLPGDTSRPDVWARADELVARTFPGPAGDMPVRLVAIDSGYNTNQVYNWSRLHPGRVFACKGVSGLRVQLGSPTDVDIRIDGQRKARGTKVWPVGVDLLKKELYGWLRLEAPTRESGKPFPQGYCHFPRYEEAFFSGITAEQLVTVKDRRGFIHHEWQVIPGRQNHPLDARVYGRAITGLVRLDQYAAKKRTESEAPASAPKPQVETEAERPRKRARTSSWLMGGSGGTVGSGGWSRRR